MAAIKIKLKDIPTINNPLRRRLINFTKEDFYQKEIEKGTPFFSEDELQSIEKRNGNKGMTKKEIMKEIYKKGWQIQESTLKSYIQKGLVPRAIKREKTDKGIISIYPSNMVRHLNFTRYCLFSKDNSINFLLAVAEFASQNSLTYLEDFSPNEGLGDTCIVDLTAGAARIRDYGIPWTEESIKGAFKILPSKKQKYLKKLKEVEEVQKQLDKKIDEFITMLKNDTVGRTPDESINLLKDSKRF